MGKVCKRDVAGHEELAQVGFASFWVYVYFGGLGIGQRLLNSINLLSASASIQGMRKHVSS